MGKKMRRVRRNRLACAVLGVMLLAETVLASGCTQTAQDPGEDVQSMVSAAGNMPESSAGSESAAASEAGETDSASQAQRPGGEAGSEAPVSEPKERGMLAVQSAEEVTAELERAIAALEQPALFDITKLEESWEDPAMGVLNLYYAVLSEHPAYKYAHSMEVQQQENGLLRCDVSYMPYVTGQYPEGFEGLDVGSFGQLVAAAREHLGEESLAVRITDPTLEVDDISRALQQAGGGYLLCALNEDGTQLTFTPLNGMTRQEALDALEQTDALAQKVYEECVRPDMTQREQAEALYAWLTENVRYDRRYYTDPASMPYNSTTAYGALSDHLAICGGYAQALQLLFEKAGIPCVTVNGVSSGENHIWDLAFLDGEWRYFDATSDRGMQQFGFRKFGVTADGLTGYTWDEAWVQRLAESLTQA